MKKHLSCLLLAIVFATMVDTLVQAQGGVTGSLSGTAVDAAGGVIPGAAVAMTNKASGTTFNTVTNERGDFRVPALDAGTYHVRSRRPGRAARFPSELVTLGRPDRSVMRRRNVGPCDMFGDYCSSFTRNG